MPPLPTLVTNAMLQTILAFAIDALVVCSVTYLAKTQGVDNAAVTMLLGAIVGSRATSRGQRNAQESVNGASSLRPPPGL